MPQLVNLEYRGDIALLKLNNPPVNALGVGLRLAALAAFEEAFASPAKAVILYGAGRAFCGGADINEFAGGLQDPDLQLLVEACESRIKPVIAAIHGVALGGGLEVAMGCAYRVAAPGAQVGLPEVKLGILPGAGGTIRLPRLLGVEEGAAWILSGNPVAVEKAAKLGVIDKIIEGDLLEGAIAFARSVADKAIVHVRDRNEKIRDVPPELLAKLRAQVARQSPHILSTYKIVDAVEACSSLAFDDAVRRERELFHDCVIDVSSLALRHIFFAEREALKVPGVPAGTAPRPMAKVAIIGAGTMGGGIAMACVNAGIDTTLIDATAEALERGLGRIRENYAATVAKGRLSQEKMDARMALLRPSVALEAVAEADIIIEAVFERMDVKLDMFRKFDTLAKPGAVLATNTSMLDVNIIAAETKRPQDVIGLHFFSPANVMRLLEVVRGTRTAPDVIATALAFAKAIGKLPVTVGVCDGFVGNRMIQPYFREAEFLAAEGASLAEIDRALTEFGLAMGPFAMSDMAGVDVRWDVEKRLAATRPEGQRYSNLVGLLGQAGRFGQKIGAGFFRYEPGSRTPQSDPAVDEMILTEAKRQGVERRQISADEVVQRCLLALVNEGANILEEGIAIRSSDIDLVYVNGYGFPAFRGGPMFWADTIGLPKILSDIEALRKKYGAYWTPSPLLQRLAANGGSFSTMPVKTSS